MVVIMQSLARWYLY